MRLLVTGASGLLGSNIVLAALDAGHDVLATYHTIKPNLPTLRRRLDITDHGSFEALLKDFGVEAVVNCAAMTDVDACESAPGQSEEVNGRTPGKLAAACRKEGSAFIQVSTDYVFDGERETKYQEDAAPNPIQSYGRTKLVGERSVRRNHPSPLIVRLSFVYGVHGATGDLEGFPAWVTSQLAEGREIPLFIDQFVTPSRVGQAAETILKLLEESTTGTYHVACRDCVSPYEFGKEICREIDADGSALVSSKMNEVTREAPRPAYTCLDVGRVEERLGRPQPALREDLSEIGEALEENG